MKKKWMLFVTFMCVILLSACSGGDVRNVHIGIGTSELYEQTEIQAAMDVVIDHFDQNFEGCTMTDLWYDESYSQKWAEGWKEQYDAEEAVVLLSNFDVDSSGGDGSLNPNSTYVKWNWILVRSDGPWELKTWGYG